MNWTLDYYMILLFFPFFPLSDTQNHDNMKMSKLDSLNRQLIFHFVRIDANLLQLLPKVNRPHLNEFRTTWVKKNTIISQHNFLPLTLIDKPSLLNQPMAPTKYNHVIVWQCCYCLTCNNCCHLYWVMPTNVMHGSALHRCFVHVWFSLTLIRLGCFFLYSHPHTYACKGYDFVLIVILHANLL